VQPATRTNDGPCFLRGYRRRAQCLLGQGRGKGCCL
jgi:hypothetical protein